MFFKNKQPALKQVAPAKTFKSNVTLKNYEIFHQLNCRSSYVMYLRQSHKMVKHTETIRRQFSDELFEYV